MNLNTLHESVRKSELIQALAGKLHSQQPIAFDYFGEFKRLCEKVSLQTGEIKILFPEFTPHDEENHLSRLFGIADKLLGTERYNDMNAAELFLLACGLYAHDWGMAVGNEELDFIRSYATEQVDAEVFTPLDNEAEVLKRFMESRGIRVNDSNDLPIISDDQLRLYIRKTHAWRSGVRVREFFKKAGSSIPQSLEKVCQGHWLDYSELDDERRFSSKAGVLGHTINLRAVAIYVRLVDLFDIADDRTPYAIWRFVAPSERVSKMEWEKHRALSPVTFPEHGDGRCVRFDGSTSDPEVWAELEDLRNYCEEQITGAMDLISRYQDHRHQLDIRRLDWKVAPERFKPVDIRFEFHRHRMFEILADEIYQGDNYVFLRELLQNSIDAIRMRRELVQQRSISRGRRGNVGLGFDDAIYFDVTHGDNGDAIVCCQDHGIGMDEYIIRNYLSVAGVSYYRSEEFNNLGLNMDPISRFGIGILSCFMVADRIEITTNKEPQMSVNQEPLYIDVPAVDRQFRVYPANGEIDFGTTVTVHVLGEKLNKDSSKLQVKQYLSEIAKFVEFPIVITEEGQRTIVLHPDRPQPDADEFRANEITCDFSQLSKEYPWSRVFLAQDIQKVKKHLRQETLDLKRDLGLTDYEGNITFLHPVSEIIDFKRSYQHYSDDAESIEIHEVDGSKVTLRQKSFMDFDSWANKEGIAPSSKSDRLCSVCRDGLLVADAVTSNKGNAIITHYRPLWPPPSLQVNLPKDLAGILDVARRTLLETDVLWDAPVWQAVKNYLKKKDFAKAHEYEPQKRLLDLAKWCTIFNLNLEEIEDLVPDTHWPLVVLTSDQGLQVKNNQLVPGEVVRIFEEDVIGDLIPMSLGWSNDNYYSMHPTINISNWCGEEVVTVRMTIHSESLYMYWMRLCVDHLGRILAPVGIRFLKPPYPGLSPLPEYECEYVEPFEVIEEDIVERMMLDPLSLGTKDLLALRSFHFFRRFNLYIAPFFPPFEKFFVCPGRKSINFCHPLTIELLRCLAAVRWHHINKSRLPAEIGKVEDIINRIFETIDSENLQSELDQLWELVERFNFVDLKSHPRPDYVPVSENSRLFVKFFSHSHSDELTKLLEDNSRSFGQPLDQIMIEEVPAEIMKLIS